jgi:hypothetical protein
MRHSGKNIQRRTVRNRGGRSGKREPNVDRELFCFWLGLSLLQEKLADGRPLGRAPSIIGRG